MDFSTLLELETICKDFKNWIHSKNGPCSQYQLIIFELSVPEEILAGLTHSGPKLDRDRLKKISSVLDVLRRFLLKEIHVCYSSSLGPGRGQMALFVDEVRSSLIGTLSTVSWHGQGKHNDNLAQLLSFYAITLSEVDVTVREDPLSVYDVLSRCSTLKALKISSMSWGFDCLDNQKSNLPVVVFYQPVSLA